MQQKNKRSIDVKTKLCVRKRSFNVTHQWSTARNALCSVARLFGKSPYKNCFWTVVGAPESKPRWQERD